MFKKNLAGKVRSVIKSGENFLKNGFKKKRDNRPLYLAVALVLVIATFSYLTNPFVRFSIITDPYHTLEIHDSQFTIEPGSNQLTVKEDPFFRYVAFVKSGWHIFISKFAGGPKAEQTNVDRIIEQIHERRFNSEQPFLISGDHFSVLYPRNLGIFYHSIIDPRTSLGDKNWQDRQRVYLKSVAYALQVYAQTEKLSTTIVPVGPRSVALMNIYSYPSDTLYGILFGLDALSDVTIHEQLYPFDVNFNASEEVVTPPPLQTQQAAKVLIDKYKTDLARHYYKYLEDVYDQETGLVKDNVLLSGAKDASKRFGSFYDNVILWKTTQLAQKLGIIAQDERFLADLKQRILTKFWNDRGVFIEDVSSIGSNPEYSSDWLVAYQVGFLEPENEQDRLYLEQAVAYIKENAIDQPFPIQYHPDLRPDKTHLMVRLATPEYGSTAIWSNWGMEYIKLLAHLAQVTGEENYIRDARQHLTSYTFNIKRYRGYPEVYDSDGDFYRKTFYKSIRQTGWVVSYQQARAMVEWTQQELF